MKGLFYKKGVPRIKEILDILSKKNRGKKKKYIDGLSFFVRQMDEASGSQGLRAWLPLVRQETIRD